MARDTEDEGVSEQLRRDKDDAARVAMEFLDKLGELPAVHADKTRFGADDVRWAAIKQLLTGLADGTEEQPADALIHDQILRHLLGVGSLKTPAYTKIAEGKGGNDARQRREEELLRVTHVLACAQPLAATGRRRACACVEAARGAVDRLCGLLRGAAVIDG